MAISRDDARHFMKRAGKTPGQIEAELGTAQAGPAKSKYHNVRTRSEIIGRNFHSDGERRFAEVLWAMQQAGEISDLKFQQSVKLLGIVSMVVDFSYIENGELIYHEFKGFKTDAWRMQRKLWGIVGPATYKVAMANGTDLVITPKPSRELIQIVLQHLTAEYVDVQTILETER